MLWRVVWECCVAKRRRVELLNEDASYVAVCENVVGLVDDANVNENDIDNENENEQGNGNENDDWADDENENDDEGNENENEVGVDDGNENENDVDNENENWQANENDDGSPRSLSTPRSASSSSLSTLSL